jgi:DNA-binding Lrp family transcriptional regulator
VLIEAEPGRLDAVLAALRAMPEVAQTDAVIGPCDIITVLESPDQNAIGQVVISAIHGIGGVRRTTTCLAIH